MFGMKPDWFVALLGVYVLFVLFHGVLNRMTAVPHPLRCAIALLIVPGVLGKVMGAAMGSWEVYVDVLLVGGLALLFTVDRRGLAQASAPSWKLPAKVAAIGALVLGGLACSGVHAQGAQVEMKSVRDCIKLGMWVQGAADIRDAGGVLERQIPIVLMRNAEVAPAVLELLVQETRRVYARPQMSADQLGEDAFERCALGLPRTPG